jgi:hypothetical protein
MSTFRHAVHIEIKRRPRNDLSFQTCIYVYYVPNNSVLFANNKAEGNGHLEELGVDASIVLTLIVKQRDWRTWTGVSWLRMTDDGRL